MWGIKDEGVGDLLSSHFLIDAFTRQRPIRRGARYAKLTGNLRLGNTQLDLFPCLLHLLGSELRLALVLAAGFGEGDALGLPFADHGALERGEAGVDRSGKDAGSPPHPPLGTVLATFTAHGSSTSYSHTSAAGILSDLEERAFWRLFLFSK